MTTVADLARLENLVNRLTPLTGKVRGELIEAGDWNQLTGALLDLAKISLGEGSSDAVPVHEHQDQVDVGWLTPKLRSLITEGGLRDPAAQAELTRIDRQLVRLMDTIESLTQRLDKIQGDVKTVETRDITRQADLTRFSRRLDGSFDAREDVATLRTTLRTLETDVRSAVDLSRWLQDETGQDIDFNQLAGRLRETEALREALTTPAGNLLDAAEYERRLEELRASLVTEEELDEALGGIRVSVETDLRDVVLEETRAITRATLEQSLAGVRAELTSSIDQRLSGLDALIDARLVPATQDLRADILTAARAERVAELDGALGGLRETVVLEREERLTQLTQQFDTQLAGQRQVISAELDATISDRLLSATTDLTSRLADVEGSMDSLQSISAGHTLAIQQNATEIAASRRDSAASDSQMRVDYINRINQLDAAVTLRIDERVGVLRTDLSTQLQGDLDIMVRSLETRLNDSIRRSVTTEVTLATNRLRTDVTAIVETQVAGLRGEIDRTITERILAGSTRINGLVTEEVSRALATLDTRIRTEVEALRPEINRVVLDSPIIR